MLLEFAEIWAEIYLVAYTFFLNCLLNNLEEENLNVVFLSINDSQVQKAKVNVMNIRGNFSMISTQNKTF